MPLAESQPFCIQHAESIDALVCLRPPHPPMLLPLSFRVWSRKTATHSSIHSFIPFHPSFLVPFPPPPFSFLFALPVLSISVFVSFDSVRVPFPVPNFPRGTFRPAILHFVNDQLFLQIFPFSGFASRHSKSVGTTSSI